MMRQQSAIQKAARLYSLLDDRAAANLMKALPRRDRMDLLAESGKTSNEPQAEDQQLLRDFLTETTQEQFGEFYFVERMRPESAATLFKDEMPQTVAAILMRIHPQAASTILSKFPLPERVTIVRQMALMDAARDAVMREVALIVKERYLAEATHLDDHEGLACLHRLIHESDPPTSLLLSATIEQVDDQLARRLSMYR